VVIMKAGAVVEESHGQDVVVMKAGAVGLAIQSEVGAKEMMELVLNDEKEHVLVYKDFREIIIPRTNIIMDDSIEAFSNLCTSWQWKWEHLYPLVGWRFPSSKVDWIGFDPQLRNIISMSHLLRSYEWCKNTENVLPHDSVKYSELENLEILEIITCEEACSVKFGLCLLQHWYAEYTELKQEDMISCWKDHLRILTGYINDQPRYDVQNLSGNIKQLELIIQENKQLLQLKNDIITQEISNIYHELARLYSISSVILGYYCKLITIIRDEIIRRFQINDSSHLRTHLGVYRNHNEFNEDPLVHVVISILLQLTQAIKECQRSHKHLHEVVAGEQGSLPDNVMLKIDEFRNTLQNFPESNFIDFNIDYSKWLILIPCISDVMSYLQQVLMKDLNVRSFRSVPEFLPNLSLKYMNLRGVMEEAILRCDNDLDMMYDNIDGAIEELCYSEAESDTDHKEISMAASFDKGSTNSVAVKVNSQIRKGIVSDNEEGKITLKPGNACTVLRRRRSIIMDEDEERSLSPIQENSRHDVSINQSSTSPNSTVCSNTDSSAKYKVSDRKTKKVTPSVASKSSSIDECSKIEKLSRASNHVKPLFTTRRAVDSPQGLARKELLYILQAIKYGISQLKSLDYFSIIRSNNFSVSDKSIPMRLPICYIIRQIENLFEMIEKGKCLRTRSHSIFQDLTNKDFSDYKDEISELYRLYSVLTRNIVMNDDYKLFISSTSSNCINEKNAEKQTLFFQVVYDNIINLWRTLDNFIWEDFKGMIYINKFSIIFTYNY